MIYNPIRYASLGFAIPYNLLIKFTYVYRGLVQTTSKWQVNIIHLNSDVPIDIEEWFWEDKYCLLFLIFKTHFVWMLRC
jgi:hypothetical protein